MITNKSKLVSQQITKLKFKTEPTTRAPVKLWCVYVYTAWEKTPNCTFYKTWDADTDATLALATDQNRFLRCGRYVYV